MNIFFLSTDPEEAAKMACDRHSIKMILESAQMSTVLRQHGYDVKLTFMVSPMPNTPQRFGQVKRGLISIGYYLMLSPCVENTLTATASFNKSEEILYRCGELREQYIPAGSLTVPPRCMGLEIQNRWF